MEQVTTEKESQKEDNNTITDMKAESITQATMPPLAMKEPNHSAEDNFSPLNILKKKGKVDAERASREAEECSPLLLSVLEPVVENLAGDSWVYEAATTQKAKETKKPTTVPDPLDEEHDMNVPSPLHIPKEEADDDLATRAIKIEEKGKKGVKVPPQKVLVTRPTLSKPQLQTGKNDSEDWDFYFVPEDGRIKKKGKTAESRQQSKREREHLLAPAVEAHADAQESEENEDEWEALLWGKKRKRKFLKIILPWKSQKTQRLHRMKSPMKKSSGAARLST
ncbi:hypothetical protein K469DRAFT_380415 [Zopfia rhizophila CBS 207.26]|uniref:Uncharacterized protein n=1 Tax=Zopfia rhizophila CBS 207.26 TaxID=1314779 RepID=A0A6A6DCF2_9PEZI|nr:hypothetical protein K469DRAFT_380415 [Zopfia rhizophila CBS 207.26]